MALPKDIYLSLSLFQVTLPPGGPSTFLDNRDSLWTALDAAAVHQGMRAIHMFTVQDGLDTTEISLLRGNTRFVFHRRQPLRVFFRALGMLRGTVILQLNNESTLDIVLGLAGKLLGARVLVFYHNDLDFARHKLPMGIVRFFRQHVIDAGMTSTLALKRKLKKHLEVPVFLFTFGVDPAILHPTTRTLSPQLRILSLGRIAPEKRIEDLIEGIALARHRDSMCLTIHGLVSPADEGYRDQLRELAQRRGVQCTIKGYVPHSVLQEVYAGADLFVNMRPDEAFGKVFMEAMATGLPVIGRSGSTGPENLIIHGESGFLVASPEELAATLDVLAADPSLRSRIGTAAAITVAKNHSSEMSNRSYARAADALHAGFVAEQRFFAAKPVRLLHRLLRVVLNRRIDVCNHTIVDGALQHAEKAALVPYCRGHGIDVGCGSNKTHPDAIGVDITPGGAAGVYGNQQNQISRADVVASGDTLSMFAQNELDYVVARHNLEHYQDPVKTLREWKRVVRIGGTIGIVIPDDTFRNTIALDPTHYHVFTPESFRSLVELIGGLRIIRLEPCIEDWSFLAIMEKIA